MGKRKVANGFYGNESHLTATKHFHAVICPAKQGVVQIDAIPAHLNGENLTTAISSGFMPNGKAREQNASFLRPIPLADKEVMAAKALDPVWQRQQRVAVGLAQARSCLQLL